MAFAKEIEVTWGRALRVWWAYFWRSIIAIIASVIVSFVLGFMFGFLGHLFGLSSGVIEVVSAILGFGTGAAFSLVCVKLILNKNYGSFRLCLVDISQQAETEQNEQTGTAE